MEEDFCVEEMMEKESKSQIIPEVTCPRCHEEHLMGPLGPGFMCYGCGWSFEFGELNTLEYESTWDDLKLLLKKHRGLTSTVRREE